MKQQKKRKIVRKVMLSLINHRFSCHRKISKLLKRNLSQQKVVLKLLTSQNRKKCQKPEPIQVFQLFQVSSWMIWATIPMLSIKTRWILSSICPSSTPKMNLLNHALSQSQNPQSLVLTRIRIISLNYRIILSLPATKITFLSIPMRTCVS